ncbi:MAG: DUF433 domain-containing protein [Planctomycetota bacterium]|jgi:uncharacterized protein (DUF433 family)
MEQPITIRDTEVKLTDVLKLIAQGYTYDQILAKHPALILGDIMATADFSRQVLEQFTTTEGQITVEHKVTLIAKGGKVANLEEIRREHPNAFKPWSRNEETQLIELHKRGESIAKIAEIHQRGRGAVKARLIRLGLLTEEAGRQMSGSQGQ